MTPASESTPVPEEGPIVRLVDYTDTPFDLSIATARTCYSSKGIINPEDVSATPKAVAIRDRVAASTLKAGHLTTRQHAQFIFTIDRVSRHLVWSFLHSHPFYNSEQVSQRYVEVKAEQYFVPASLRVPGRERLLELYLGSVRLATGSYFTLMESLAPAASDAYYQVFPARKKRPERWEKGIHKKVMEVARYVLPTATYTYLYHTVNGLTLHRYRRLCDAFDTPAETRLLVDRMFEVVRAVDPLFAGEMADPVRLEDTPEYQFFAEQYGGGPLAARQIGSAAEFVREFDERLHTGGRFARLAGYNPGAPETLADAVRAVLGASVSRLSDADAIELALNPNRNHHLSSTLNESSVSRITRALYNVQYSFQKKISHTADSQDQRHRMVPGARPVLMSHYTGRPDYITPILIDQGDEALREQYEVLMEKIFDSINAFIDAGGTAEEAVYLLPNAFPVRFYESGDLLNLYHKWKTRTCYNAQEEIFRASVEELDQVARVHPGIARWIKAPCYVRKIAGVKPFCPEGDHFCGVAVWDLEIGDYQRTI